MATGDLPLRPEVRVLELPAARGSWPDARALGEGESLGEALSALSPADVAVLSRACQLPAGWVERLQAAAHSDSTVASASALTLQGGSLALAAIGRPVGELVEEDRRVQAASLRLRPRLRALTGPCIMLRRDALELAGPARTLTELSERLSALGLGHVAADDLVVAAEELPPDTAALDPVATRALEAARRPRARLDVTIDLRSLTGALGGTQVHVLELTRALAATGALEPRFLLAQEAPAEVREELAELGSVLGADELGPELLPTTIFHRPQQLFSPIDMRLATRLGRRLVVGQLDLIAFHNPTYAASAADWAAMRRWTRQGLAAAAMVVVSSEHTRAELLREELVDGEGRVRVIAPGVDHRRRSEARRPEGVAEDERGFLLCLGSDFRHKNRPFAIRLHRELVDRHGFPGALVLAGAHVEHGSSRAEELRLDRAGVRDLGAVDDGERAWLVEHSAALLYPTVYEGFGLIPLEAALAGRPCLWAAIASLADVLPAEEAVLVPWDVRASAERAAGLLADPEGQVQRVRARAERLTWRACAEAHVELFAAAAVAPIAPAEEMARHESVREEVLRRVRREHDEAGALLERQRLHATRMYEELLEATGAGRSLVGPEGLLPDDVQRALLALGTHPGVARPLLQGAAAAVRGARRLRRH